MKKRKKVKRKIIAYALTLCFTALIIGILYLGYMLIFKNNEPQKSFLESIETTAYVDIDKYAIYGIHLNFEGTFTLPEDAENISLMLSNGEKQIKINWELTKKGNNQYSFKTSKYINEGIVLENIPQGEYYLVIETINHDEEENEVKKYYSVENNTEYEDLEYYTLTKNGKNNKIDIEWNTYEEIPTLKFTIKETTLPDDVYDITIDPGHDAVDGGMTACSDGSTSDYYYGCYTGTMIRESDLNLEVGLELKKVLEDMGYKVAMTRDDPEDEVYIYEKGGSATLANDTKSKFSLAIHHNSSGMGGTSYLKGLELYIANDTNLDLAEIFVNQITQNANTTTSPKQEYNIADGIYQRFFTLDEIGDDLGFWTTDMIYYYYIREVGGISTHAAQDGIYKPDYAKNEHYDSNNTAEPYLFELGYMDNYENLLNILNNRTGYAQGIATALQKYLDQEV